MAGRPEGTYGHHSRYVAARADEIIDARRNGEACRSIALRYGVPEWTIHSLMRRTGNEGRFRAGRVGQAQGKQSGGVAGKRSDADILERIGAQCDELVIERLADDSGWIATIDDLTGDPHERISGALRSAYEKWRA